MNEIIANKGKSNEEILTLVQLQLEHIDQIITLQDRVVDSIIKKEIYASSSRKEFEDIIKEIGCIMGYQTQEGKIVALGAYSVYGYNEHNYGYDLDFEGEALLNIGQVESILVDSDYRGNGLQRKICTALEEVARLEEKRYIAATVSPDNSHSLNNFLALGYEIKKEKLKYGGLRRYILCKSLR